VVSADGRSNKILLRKADSRRRGSSQLERRYARWHQPLAGMQMLSGATTRAGDATHMRPRAAGDLGQGAARGCNDYRHAGDAFWHLQRETAKPGEMMKRAREDSNLYAVRVPRIAISPPPSSPPRLTTAPLASACGWCHQPPRGTFTPERLVMPGIRRRRRAFRPAVRSLQLVLSSLVAEPYPPQLVFAADTFG
jgi:hypothetical protein